MLAEAEVDIPLIEATARAIRVQRASTEAVITLEAMGAGGDSLAGLNCEPRGSWFV